jgi:hypothetical protein
VRRQGTAGRHSPRDKVAPAPLDSVTRKRLSRSKGWVGHIAIHRADEALARHQ